MEPRSPRNLRPRSGDPNLRGCNHTSPTLTAEVATPGARANLGGCRGGTAMQLRRLHIPLAAAKELHVKASCFNLKVLSTPHDFPTDMGGQIAHPSHHMGLQLAYSHSSLEAQELHPNRGCLQTKQLQAPARNQMLLLERVLFGMRASLGQTPRPEVVNFIDLLTPHAPSQVFSSQTKRYAYFGRRTRQCII